MIGYLADLPAPVWSSLKELPRGRWLWLDMVRPGLHVGDLPDDPTTQLTHLWGWGNGWWVRVRADVDMEQGMGGLILTSERSAVALRTAPDWKEASVVSAQRRTWATTDAEVSVDPLHAEFPPNLRELTVRLTTTVANGLWQVPIHFMDTIAEPGERLRSHVQ